VDICPKEFSFSDGLNSLCFSKKPPLNYTKLFESLNLRPLNSLETKLFGKSPIFTKEFNGMEIPPRTRAREGRENH
jgi:hypothetical protein